MNIIVLNNTRCCTIFPSLSFYSKGFFTNKVLTKPFSYQWTPKGECYELMVVHWFDTVTHMINMINTHMIYYFLCKYLY